jgi:hypothetical protein
MPSTTQRLAALARSAKLCEPDNSKRIFIFDKPSISWQPHSAPGADTSQDFAVWSISPSIRLVLLGPR